METNLIEGKRYRIHKTGYTFHNYILEINYTTNKTKEGYVNIAKRTLRASNRSHVKMKDVEAKLKKFVEEMTEAYPEIEVRSFSVTETISVFRGKRSDAYVKRQCPNCGKIEHVERDVAEMKHEQKHQSRECFSSDNNTWVIIDGE